MKNISPNLKPKEKIHVGRLKQKGHQLIPHNSQSSDSRFIHEPLTVFSLSPRELVCYRSG